MSNPQSTPSRSSLHNSHWVQASAGSGKTKILTDRILECLLEGTPHQKILALTFTKAAASEMEERVLKTAAYWGLLSLEELEKELTTFFPKPSSLHIERAHSLFNTLTQGDALRIQTLHAFCHTLLSQFPIESDLTPGFTLLDNPQTQDFFSEVIETLKTDIYEENQRISDSLTHAFSPLDPILTVQDLNRLNPSWNNATFEALCRTILQRSRSFNHFFDKLHSGFKDPIPLEKLQEEALTEFLTPPSLPLDVLSLWHELLKESGAETSVLKQFLSSSLEERVLLFESYRSLFLTQQNTPRKVLLSKGLQLKKPSLLEHLLQEQNRILELENARKQIGFEAMTHSFHLLAYKLVSHYTTMKFKKNLLDYEDLLHKTHDLLTKGDAIPWILFKLDHSLDHILLDEAQDTNAIQWKIVLTLFMHLQDNQTSNTPKTLFVVGDEKQSIYGFQGAHPKLFQDAQEQIVSLLTHSSTSLIKQTLDFSWRSCPAVIQTVEGVFEDPSLRKSLSYGDWRPHKVTRCTHPGEVDLWPLITKSAHPDQDFVPTSNQQLAQAITQTIIELVDKKTFLPSLNRPAQYGDILILVRKRSSFIDDLIRLLKSQNIPVLGKDLFILQDHLGIQDLLALGNWVLCPDDDYALACLLKGPFFTLPDAALEHLATTRSDMTLFERLELEAQQSPYLPTVLEKLHTFQEISRSQIPSTFFSNVLTQCGGRQSLLNHFGTDILDFIEIFMERVCHLEQANHYSLPLTLHELTTHSTPIKRDLSTPSPHHVRIMTVHGAKGLQSPIVILPDTTTVPSGPSCGELLWHQGIPLLIPQKSVWPQYLHVLVDEAKITDLEEYMRLLYVALTRTQDKLIVGGALSDKRKLPDECWYAHIHKALKKYGIAASYPHLPISHEDGQKEPGYRLYDPKPKMPLCSLSADAQDPLQSTPLPEWCLQTSLSTEEYPIEPSAWKNPESDTPSLQQGILLHGLLEELLPCPTHTWELHGPIILKNLIQRYDYAPTHEAQSMLLRKIYPMATKESLNFLLDPRARREVSVVGLGGERPITIRIDFLLETEDCVWIIDYKSDILPPLPKSAVFLKYKTQLELYTKIIQNIYPYKKIRRGILWIETLELFEL